MTITFHSHTHDTVEENHLGVVHNVQASLNGGLADEGLVYSIYGADADDFTIDSATGELRFISVPDYEAPQDADADNIYELEVTASNGNSDSASQSLTVAVRDDRFEVAALTGPAPAVLELSSLDGSNGFTLNGIDAGDQSGYSVSGVGDVNGDGYADVIIGARFADPNGSSSGESYVVFGKSDGFDAAIELSSLDGTNGFVINGIDSSDESGTSVSGAGDVNGDGYDDLIIGAPDGDPNSKSNAGESYVVFGANVDFNPVLELSSLDGTNGFVINGIGGGDTSGWSVSSAGDINGDGYDDLIIGARYADPNGSSSGESYVVFGASGGFDAAIELSSLDGNNGFILNGLGSDARSGWSVSSAGDINGDGYDDLLIGAVWAAPNSKYKAGAAYVVFGKSGSFDAAIELSGLNGNNGFVLNGASAGDFTGASISNAGDVNGDGYDDIIIGANLADPNGSSSGESYVLFGSGGAFDSVIELSNLDGNNGFTLNGIDAGDRSGRPVSSAGDVNGDGYDDILIGAPLADPTDKSNAGESYLMFGKSGDFDPVIELSSLEGNNGFVINGIDSGDNSGRRSGLSAAGDVNGDGYDDLIIGAKGADPNGSESGESYVIFGGPTLFGDDDTSGDDTIFGTSNDDTYDGGAGNDYIHGKKGDDLIDGGDGDDRLIGGNGRDTLNGGADNDFINGKASHDLIDGGSGDDDVYGASGHDTMNGGDGDDTLSGGAGNDQISGGSGDDHLTGDGGADVFIFAAGSGDDTVTDFNISEGDVIDLSATSPGFGNIDQLAASAVDTADGLLIDLGGGNSVTLTGISVADLFNAPDSTTFNL